MTQPASKSFFVGADALTDNLALIEWCENSRRILHAGALELGICASELDAKLRTVSGGLSVGGLSGRRRANQVSRPIGQASEALVVASQYIITASNRFVAAFDPELSAAGYRGARKPDFKFKA
ncbi:hypothetical protein [Micromonospora polyrhachis]|uniref:Uncharacterized protein n=1 Tax=Micromonospora polyrhachis TaxID=1282883 RepID=A0A7W7SQ83_9ACTN|nr:hypothetical protein [Micromonospora polyrhachis]MBB4958972.1 hypothetical protein [Micromonospora polyrhachis]